MQWLRATEEALPWARFVNTRSIRQKAPVVEFEQNWMGMLGLLRSPETARGDFGRTSRKIEMRTEAADDDDACWSPVACC